MPQKHKIRHSGPRKPHTCGGKRCYATKHEAETVKIEQEIINSGLTLAIYRCVQCSQWHLTRQTDATTTQY